MVELTLGPFFSLANKGLAKTFHAMSVVSHIRIRFTSSIWEKFHSFISGIPLGFMQPTCFLKIAHVSPHTQGGLTQGSNGREWKTQIRVPPTPSLHPKNCIQIKKCTSTWCVSRTWHRWFLWFCFFHRIRKPKNKENKIHIISTWVAAHPVNKLSFPKPQPIHQGKRQTCACNAKHLALPRRNPRNQELGTS